MRRMTLPAQTRRSVLAAVTAAATSLPALACGAGGGAQGGGAAKTADAGGTVVWLSRTQAQENQWEQGQVVPAFGSRYPKVKVDLLIVPSAEFDPKLTSMAAADQPPDLFSQWGNGGFGDYIIRGLPLDLTSRIARDKVDPNSFLPGVFDLYKRDGKYYSTPQVTNYGTSLIYNKDLFQQAGLPFPGTDWDDKSWTWDKFVDAAKKLTKNAGGGASAQYGFDLGTLKSSWPASYLWGGDPFLPEHYKTGLAKRTQFESPAVAAAIQAQADLINKLHVAPTADDTKALTPPSGGVFATGKIAMTTALIPGTYKNLVDATFKWGVAPLPRQKDNKPTVFNGTWFIAKGSKNPDATWELIKYLVSEDNARDMAQTTGFLVPLKGYAAEWLKLLNGPTGMSADDLRKVTEGGLKIGVENVNHLFVDWPQLNTAINEMLNPVFDGKTTADAAIREAKPKVDAQVQGTYDQYSRK